MVGAVGEAKADELVLAALELAARVVRDRTGASPREALMRVRTIVASIAMRWPRKATPFTAKKRHAPTSKRPRRAVQIPEVDPRQLSLFTDG